MFETIGMAIVLIVAGTMAIGLAAAAIAIFTRLISEMW